MRGDQASAAPEHVSLEAVAELRAAAYGLLGELFLLPTEERMEEVVREAARLDRLSESGPGYPFEIALHSLLDELTGSDAGRWDALRNEYARLFTATDGESACLPYESHFVADQRSHGAVAAELEQAYAECGLTISASAGGELPDHVALELQFLSALCEEEAACWANADAAGGEVWLRRERAFLHAHVGRFFPTFARCVLRNAPESSLYRKLAQAAHAFVVHDGDLAETLLGVDDEVGS